MIADVIDNDSWRIWPQGREELMLDKQMYRNLRKRRRGGLDRVKESYERVADIVGTFPRMRPGMVAIIADGPAVVELRNNVVRPRPIRLADGASHRVGRTHAGIRAATGRAARRDLRPRWC